MHENILIYLKYHLSQYFEKKYAMCILIYVTESYLLFRLLYFYIMHDFLMYECRQSICIINVGER